MKIDLIKLHKARTARYPHSKALREEMALRDRLDPRLQPEEGPATRLARLKNSIITFLVRWRRVLKKKN